LRNSIQQTALSIQPAIAFKHANVFDSRQYEYIAAETIAEGLNAYG
jgi:hypothetical protein